MDKKKDQDHEIGRWSWKYAIVKFLVKSAFFVFYRRIYVSGRENIPEGGRLIFAANHQNALMDPLAIIFTSKYQPVFLARADVFNKPLIARILRFLKIMPVYRFRDGMDAMGQNEDTFRKTTSILASGGCIGILPEGSHGAQKRLRTLKKGTFRIAFRAAGEPDNPTDVKIVPVGLDYSDTRGVFEDIVVNYGKPIAVSGYPEYWSHHPQKGINAMKDDFFNSLQSLMIDIKDEQNYEKDKLLVDTGSSVLNKRLYGRSGDLYKRFVATRAFSQALYEYFEKDQGKSEELRSKSGKAIELLRVHGIFPGSLEKPGNREIFLSTVKKILCFPLVITGLMLHILPVAVIRLILKRLKDPQFISSFIFVLGMLLLPLNYLLLAILFLLMAGPLVTAAVLVPAPLLGYIAYVCFRSSERLKDKIYFNRLCRQDKAVASLITGLKPEIISDLEPVLQIAEERLK